MSDTINIAVSQTVWIDITQGLKNGLITNNSFNSIRYREASIQPNTGDTFGHVIHPQQEIYFDLTGASRIWALGFTHDAAVAVTGGLGVTKDLSFNRDFFFEVSQGNVEGHLSINKFGNNSDVPSAGTEDIWAAGGTLTHLQAADTMTVRSTDSGDNLAGVGARSVFIEGLDANFNDITEILLLHPTDGTIPVTTVNSYVRIWRVFVLSVGVYGGSNLGDIIIADTTNAFTQSFILTNEGQNDGTHYTVPAGKTVYMMRPSLITNTSKSVDIITISRFDADVVVAPFRANLHREHWKGLDAPFAEQYKVFKVFPAKTDLWFQCSNSGGSASSVTVKYDMIVVDD